MIFEFLQKVASVSEKQIVHIIEHEGNGTIHHLIEPLQEDINQHVVCTCNLVNMKFIKENFCYILHVTGHMYPIISHLEEILENNIKVFVFLHVAPNYFVFKRKEFFFEYLLNIQSKYDFKCFSPSNNVAQEYKKLGLKVQSIQVGFPKIQINIPSNVLYLRPYCDKYISICTSSDPRYIALKGINDFVDLVDRFNIRKEAIILGFDGMYRGVKCKRLDLNSFLYVLANSKAYIQLSKTEAYNLTALQAKRLKIPTLVSNIDGHMDCMKFNENHVQSILEFENKMKKVTTVECIDQNYNDSINRESLENFIMQINKNVKGE